MWVKNITNPDSPHFWWLVIILSTTIIALVAYIFTCRVLNAYRIMEYISYASVILSITLSIFAILYTYTSNVQIQQQFEKINSAANNIISTSDKLATTGSKLNESLETILDHLTRINNKQEEISGQMNNINSQLSTNVANITNIPQNRNGNG